MAISWGAWEYSGGNGMRVGIDVDIENPHHTTLGCTFTVRIYTENQYTYSDNQTLSYGGNIGGSTSFNNSQGGAVTLRATKTHIYDYPVNSYGTSPGTRTFSAALSGAFNGVTPSKSVTVTIPARPIAAPAAPSAVALTRISDTSGKQTWTNNSTAGEPYEKILVQRSVNGGALGTVYHGAVISSLNHGFAANWKVRYQVRSENSAGVSAMVSSGFVWTSPAAPTSPARSGGAGANQVLTWVNNVGYAEYETQIERAIDGVWGGVLATVGSGVTTYTDTTATDSSKSYSYRMRARGTSGNGTSLYSGYATTSSSPTITNPPAAPSGIVRTLNAQSQPTLSWTNNATTAAPYASIEIQRRDTQGNIWETIATIGGGSTGYSDATAGNNLKFEYQIRSINAAGQSAYVGAGSFIWTKPATPINIQWLGIDNNADDVVDDFRVTWENTAGYTEYQTEVWRSANGVWEGTPRATLAAGVTQWTDVNPVKTTAWAYRVRHKSTTGPSAPLYSEYITSTPTSALTRAPKPPVSLNPNSATVTYDPRVAQTLTWSFVRDDIDQSDQTGFDLQHRAAGGAWTVVPKVTSGVSSWTLPANTYTVGTTVEWQVRTYNAHTAPSDWSAIASFSMQLPPPPKQPKKRALQLDLDTGNTEGTAGRLPSTATGIAVVKAIATTNRSLFGKQTVDSVALAEGDRVLLTQQTNKAENGIWVVANADWVRGNDADTSKKAALKMVSVDQGGSLGGTLWSTNFKSIDTLGTTPMVWTAMLNTTEQLPAMLLRRDTAQTITGATAWTLVALNTEAGQSRGNISATSSQIVIQQDGWYQLSGWVNFSAASAEVRRLAAIAYAGSTSDAAPGTEVTRSETTDQNYFGASLSGTRYLTAGTVVRLAVWVGSLNGNNVDAARLTATMIQSLPGVLPVQFKGFTQSDIDPGTWANIGTSGAPVFGSSWSNYDAVNWPVASIRKDGMRVELRGMVKSTVAFAAGAQAANASATVFVLPAGYRPAKSLHLPRVDHTNGVSRWNILSTGEVKVNYGTVASTANQWYSLDGISFIADGA